MADSAKRLLLLDTASLYFRAFFGIPDTIRAPDGTPVNALRGLLDFVARLVSDYRPDAIAACWDDDWRPAWRVELLPTYKAHRVEEVVEDDPDVEETPDLLSPQVPLIAEALGLLGIAVVGAADNEADDVIGTLTHRWDGPVDIVTGDRDLFQLVDDALKHRVLYTARGVGNLEQVTDEVIVGKYGVRPHQYVDFAVLRGDPSDGLPGIAGIGDKTAAALVREYGTLDAIREAAGDRWSDIKPRARRNIVEGADYLDVAPKVVRVASDAAIGDPELSLGPIADSEAERFREFAVRWGLGGAEQRILDALAHYR
ncbi:5'-3' exonuclease [Solicola gregarius]|uniref:5'-3' exonuclease n=1 Tax=Solicola gregarius TaxID=2908642 RepID=A0AA46TGR4_9ACTN|nr:5'-3' exonuclease [Solicola gregarius]UYM05064.1 5'-3' exonuclease [Solicola gregarius]